MRTHFAEVLARESACLAGVTDGAKLAGWRRRVVEELMTPLSPYVLAMRQAGDVPDRADFLDRWRDLIAETVDRLLQSGTTGDTHFSSDQSHRADVDAQKTAVLILAALHGGSTLSQISQDPWPLNAALDLALAPFAATEDNCPIGSMNP
ncbi:hypothetical protein GCM10009530_73520 [Microbispora corallina]|uniref:TetR family transcriptional regulator n=1 Tax=Microbispora corallina TaxID=83302 RepID=A0ABQ4GB03_9ACTN|nr:hypothetical protein [Microbispora corallina]GIH44247.1 hypothetical protein Mco01_72470 [Microbispora corallina]